MDDVEIKFHTFYNLEVSPNNTFLIEGVSDLYVMYKYLTSKKYDSKTIIKIKDKVVENLYAPFSIIVTSTNINAYKQTIGRIRCCNKSFNKIIFTINMDAVTCKDIVRVLPAEGIVRKFMVNNSIIHETTSTFVSVYSLLSHTKFKDICIPRGSLVSYSIQDKTLYIENESKKFEALLLLQANL